MQYLNKRFLKFAFGFLLIIAASLLVIVATSAYAAGVEQIVFTTAEQSTKPNEVSETITIQIQDISGTPTSMGETADLFLTSDSATGEFSSSNSNWQNVEKVTVNSNWENRSFYYRDSSGGSFVITANLVGRNSGQEFNATQKIVVSSSGSTQSTSSSGSGGSSSAGSSSSSSGSSISGPVSGSSAQLEVSAGSDRLTSPGSPITFQATIKKNTASNAGLNLFWSFGDGNVGTGLLVHHIYKYPGEYVVVLNAKAGGIFAISRVKVRVIEPIITLSESAEYVEIANNTSSEINLFNWKIISEGRGFIFQPDTIVLPNSKIKLEKNMLKMKGELEFSTILRNSFGQLIASSDAYKNEKDMATIALQFETLQNQAMQIVDQALAKNLIQEKSSVQTSVQPIVGEVAGEEADYQEMLREGEDGQEALGTMDTVLYEAPKQTGFFARAWQFLVSMIR